MNDRTTASAILKKWEDEGADHTNLYEWRDRFHVYATWKMEVVRTPVGTAMPRGSTSEFRDPPTQRLYQYTNLIEGFGWWTMAPPSSTADFPEHVRKKLERFLLFSIHTRHYLRRRAWRYFRRLGKKQPERYLPAITAALRLYRDQDMADGLALIDNWGLVHILFHHSPALVAKTNGWTLADGHTLAELAPAPIYEQLWKANPHILLGLLKEARCRPVRQWTIRMIRRDVAAVLGGLPLEELLGLLAHEDAEVVALAAESLRQAPGLTDLSLERWLALLETPNPAALEILCELITKHVAPEKVTLEQAAQLALRRPLPIVRLGFTLLQNKRAESEADCRALLALTESEAEPVRPQMVRWVRRQLSGSPHFDIGWVLEYLDSRYADVRAEGWAWFQEEPALRDNVDLWRKLLESPYDDVRLWLVADLEALVGKPGRTCADHAALNPELLRFLWATVLLNIHRGNRSKPLVVQQVVRRLERRPEEAPSLLPILAVALRSIRSPEWRAGLAGLVQLLERNPQLETAVTTSFPELQLNT